MEETIKLKCDKTGRLEIKDHVGNVVIKRFSTPNSDGMEFNRLFNDIKEGDVVVLTFENVRICRLCGRKMEKKK